MASIPIELIGGELMSKISDASPINAFVDGSKEIVENAALSAAEKIPILGSIIKKGSEVLGEGEDWVADKISSGVDGIKDLFGFKTTPEITDPANITDAHIHEGAKALHNANNAVDLENFGGKFKDVINDMDQPFTMSNKLIQKRLPNARLNFLKGIEKPLNEDGSLNFGQDGIIKDKGSVIRKIFDRQSPFTLAEKQVILKELPNDPAFKRLTNVDKSEIERILEGKTNLNIPPPQTTETLEQFDTSTLPEKEIFDEPIKEMEPVDIETPTVIGASAPVETPTVIDEPVILGETPTTELIDEPIEFGDTPTVIDEPTEFGASAPVEETGQVTRDEPSSGMVDKLTQELESLKTKAQEQVEDLEPITKGAFDKITDSKIYKNLVDNLSLQSVAATVGTGAVLYEAIFADGKPHLGVKDLIALTDVIAKVGDDKKKLTKLDETVKVARDAFNRPTGSKQRNIENEKKLISVTRERDIIRDKTKTDQTQVEKTIQLMARKEKLNDQKEKSNILVQKMADQGNKQAEQAVKSGIIRPSAAVDSAKCPQIVINNNSNC